MSYNTVGIIKNGVKQKLPVVMVAPKVDGPDYVEVVADGVKTWSQLLDSLYALADLTKITNYSLVEDSDGVVFVITYNSTSWVRFACASYSGQGSTVTELIIQSSGSLRRYARGTNVADESSTVVTSGHKLTLYYDTATLDLTTRASNSVYDNSNSGLSATDAQGAIDEVNSKLIKTYTRDIGGTNLSAQSSGVNYGVIVPSALSGHHVISIFLIDTFNGDLYYMPFENNGGANPGVVIYSNTRTSVPSGVKIGFRYI